MGLGAALLKSTVNFPLMSPAKALGTGRVAFTHRKDFLGFLCSVGKQSGFSHQRSLGHPQGPRGSPLLHCYGQRAEWLGVSRDNSSDNTITVPHWFPRNGIYGHNAIPNLWFFTTNFEQIYKHVLGVVHEWCHQFWGNQNFALFVIPLSWNFWPNWSCKAQISWKWKLSHGSHLVLGFL